MRFILKHMEKFTLSFLFSLSTILVFNQEGIYGVLLLFSIYLMIALICGAAIGLKKLLE